jgi:hypothetical protein
MTRFFRSDLFRNFLGGFAIGAVAMVALQPDDVFAARLDAPAASAMLNESAAD